MKGLVAVRFAVSKSQDLATLASALYFFSFLLGNLWWCTLCEEEGKGEAQSEVAVGGKGKLTDL